MGLVVDPHAQGEAGQLAAEQRDKLAGPDGEEGAHAVCRAGMAFSFYGIRSHSSMIATGRCLLVPGFLGCPWYSPKGLPARPACPAFSGGRTWQGTRFAWPRRLRVGGAGEPALGHSFIFKYACYTLSRGSTQTKPAGLHG